MRKFLISAAMIGLVAAVTPVVAQDREHHDQAGTPHEEHGAPQRGAPQPHGGQRPQAGPEHGARPGSQAQGGPEHGRPQPNNALRRNAMRGNPGPATRGPANAMRGPAMRSGEAHDFSRVHNYHQNFNATRRFHAAAYAPPRGYYAHHWTWGETLPPLFWARPYWLLDFAAYDLPPPPFGAVWVRVGSDALLIDQTSGMIIEVDYGVFY